ncbi:MAG TPA: ThuA domain-containing protein, partial [Solirubrobacter sp.]
TGTNTDTSTQEDPTYTYVNAGTYTAKVTVTDAQGIKASATVDVRVTGAPNQCDHNAKSDEFNGSSLDLNRWTVRRSFDNFTVSNGELVLPIDNGSIYQGGTSAGNIITQPTPSGVWTVTAKVRVAELNQNYQQAGLRVYSDDDNWASVHMISAGGARQFEFIYENAGTPRNEAADHSDVLAETAPLAYYVRIHSDGTNLTASYSFDGDTFTAVGRPAPLSTFSNPQIGPVALSDSAPNKPNSYFDWVRFDPDTPAGGGGNTVLDEFNGTDIASPPWDVVRRDQAMTVGAGALHIPAAPGDIYGDKNDAKNLVMRAAPTGAWTATTKVAFEGTDQWHQAGMILYTDDGNFVKFGRIATETGGTGVEKFEFIAETNGTPRNEAADSTPSIPAAFPKDYYLRMVSDGTNVTGAYSTDGTTWTPVGRPAAIPAGAKIGMFAFSNAAATSPVADFDWFRIEGAGGGGGTPSGPSRDDDFSGTSLDKSRWNAIVRDNPASYNVSGGNFNLTTELGDIYTGDTNPPPNNFILQSADHAGADWVIETKLSSTITDGYAQGGLIAYVDGDNYVKFDAISDTGQTRINRLELRSEVGGAIQNPTPADPLVAAGTTNIWLRLKKAGTTYSGEYSFDGTTWTAVASTTPNPMQSPKFGLFSFGPQAPGVGDVTSFDYFTLDGQDPPSGCSCNGPGDEFDGTALDASKWNAILRPDDTKAKLEDGKLKITTVLGDIYTNGDASGTRNFILQKPTKEDYVLETKVDVTQLNGGYAQGGILVRTDDDNYVKFDAISDVDNPKFNRIELRSEQAGAILNPQPQVTTGFPAVVTDVWLRLTKTGTTYKGEYSLDGSTWTALSAEVTNTQTNAPFGLFTLGVQIADRVVGFEYFKVDGSTGCPPTEPENSAPVISAISATPSTGFAPLPVKFDTTASDEDNDALTYSWDFGDGSAASTAEDPSHTYTTPGTYTAKLTVTDGKAPVSRTVVVNVFGPDQGGDRFRVLVFSKTTGFRHDSIPAGIAAIKKLGADNHFGVDASEDSAAVFTDSFLSHYDAVVFLSTTGDPLDDTQQAAFERYIRGGGGYVGIHAAADTEYTWTWYGKLVGAYFRNHPAGTPTATVHIEDTDHHSTTGLPNPWQRVDEWYNYQAPDGAVVGGGGTDFSPRAAGVHVLATVDESTYDEDDGNTTDDDHPISWCHRYDGGRSWYTGMGHTQASFAEAPYLKHLLGGLEVAAGAVDDADCGDVGGNHAPTVTAQRNPSGDVSPGDPVAFTAQGTDADGDALTYEWDFGDGGKATTKDAMHTYNEVGVFHAKVTVSDGKGGKDSVLLQVNVQPVGDNSEEVGVGGLVPGVLALDITGSANFGTFLPGVTKDYTTSLAATVTTSATAAELTVRDASSNHTGHLVNGTSF